MGFFGRGNRKNVDSDEDRQRQADEARAAERQYTPLVQECLTRVQAWAFPYSQIEGWDIWHADAQGQRVTDIRVQLILADTSTFTVKSLFWGDTDIENSSSYSEIELTAVDLYDALRRSAVQQA